MKLKNAMRGGESFYRGKVWLDILVQKPNNRGDAVNLLDSICDVVKEAIGIDDRYFSIRRLDWEIVKKDPLIYIGIGQEISEHHFCCTYCGRMVPESEKSAHKRTCKNCRFGTPIQKPEYEAIDLSDWLDVATYDADEQE
jgi:hypothetical protein